MSTFGKGSSQDGRRTRPLRGGRPGLTLGLGLMLVPVLGLVPSEAGAQGRGNQRGAETSSVSVSSGPEFTLSVDIGSQIREFYVSHPVGGVEALPPGIRRNLAQGKPLPPGIAKKSVPDALLDRIQLPRGYELVEVGLDVFLVEVATGIVHDFLMDVIR